jgi:indole-3-glycerol phosphate synthase
MTQVQTGTILDRILEQTAADLAKRKAAVSIGDLERIAKERAPALSLHACLARPGIGVIAEIKRASPSRGRFAVEIQAASVAAEYAAGGAVAISVLTDEPFFHGSLEDLESVAAIAHDDEVSIPVLRKDFVIDPYQIVEARARGADAVLLIVGALDEVALGELLATAGHWGMDALVEVHDEGEMARAATVGARVIGINNRDLKSFTVDLATTERLAPLAPDKAVVVSESGIFGPEEVERLARAGADAVLVGEGLITARDRVPSVRALWEWSA